MDMNVLNAANAAGFGNDHVTACDDFFLDVRVCEDVMLRSRSRERGGEGRRGINDRTSADGRVGRGRLLSHRSFIVTT